MTAYGCYTLDLYCDRINTAHEYGEFPHTYTGNNKSQCVGAARRDGWRIGKSGVACPTCNRKPTHPERPER